MGPPILNSDLLGLPLWYDDHDLKLAAKCIRILPNLQNLLPRPNLNRQNRLQLLPLHRR